MKRSLGYYSQVKCAFALVEDFLDELKRLGRYDSSTIVIHSDTGHGHCGFIRREHSYIMGSQPKKRDPALVFIDNPLHWTRSQLISRTMALLMIKPAGKSGPMKYSDKLSQLIDLRPTLADMLDLPGGPPVPDGISLVDDKPTQTRNGVFFVYPVADPEPDMMRLTLLEQSNPSNGSIRVKGYKGKHPATGIGSNVTFEGEGSGE
jgi:arylsulfatase A-like enzyme